MPNSPNTNGTFRQALKLTHRRKEVFPGASLEFRQEAAAFRQSLLVDFDGGLLLLVVPTSLHTRHPRRPKAMIRVTNTE